jgi:hypothetical protein
MRPLWLGHGKTSFSTDPISQSAPAGGALPMRLPMITATPKSAASTRQATGTSAETWQPGGLSLTSDGKPKVSWTPVSLGLRGRRRGRLQNEPIRNRLRQRPLQSLDLRVDLVRILKQLLQIGVVFDEVRAQ